MERVVHIAKSFREAEEWDIMQAISLTPEQRQEIARVLKERVYGRYTLDVRASRAFAKRTLKTSEQ